MKRFLTGAAGLAMAAAFMAGPALAKAAVPIAAHGAETGDAPGAKRGGDASRTALTFGKPSSARMR